MREHIVHFGTVTSGDETASGAAEIHGDSVEDRIIAAIRTVYDPEIPVNLYDLGLIYAIDIDTANRVCIQMTLTAPGCPVAGTLPTMVQKAVAGLGEFNDVCVELVWDPPWSQEMMSDEARLELGLL